MISRAAVSTVVSVAQRDFSQSLKRGGAASLGVLRSLICVLGGFQRLCAASEGLEKTECSTLHAYASVSGGF